MTEKIPFVDEYYSLWLLLCHLVAAVYKARHKKYGKYIHSNQAAALVTVWALDGKVTPAALARELFLEPHTVSELVIRMEKKGLIQKNKDKKRENVVRISITAKGREFCRQIVKADFIRGIMAALDKKQREQVRELLNLVYAKALEELEYPKERLFI